jgi:hypothetical protein
MLADHTDPLIGEAVVMGSGGKTLANAIKGTLKGTEGL